MDLFGIEFKRTFGFRPSRVIGMKSHEQEFVERKLQTLARYFHSCTETQKQILAQKASEGDTLTEIEKNLRAHSQSLRDAAQSVKWAKTSFWQAHKLAKRQGYYTQAKHTDYLAQEARNRR